MDLLSGLEKFGFKNLGSMEIYKNTDKEVESKSDGEPKKIVYQEKDFLFDKSYECPVCGKSFKNRTVRSGKLRLIESEKDLKPVYDQMEPLKYDVVLCPYCGYAVLTRFFGGLTSTQVKAIREEILSSFQPFETENDTYSYEEALIRYKLCLASTIVKHGKPSEKAYVCLKAGWILRDMGKELNEGDQEYEEKLEKYRNQETEFLKNALEGFVIARQTESYPVCGMDEITLDYLIAVLAMEVGKTDFASKLISNILVSKSANNRIKDKARALKEDLLSVKNI